MKKKVEYSCHYTPVIEPYEHIRVRPQWYFTELFEEKTLDSIPLEIVQYAMFWKKEDMQFGINETVGLIRMNAASEWCKLLKYSNGQKGEFHFKEGETETRTICGSDEKKNYTKITVKPDATIFPNLKINPKTLQEKIDEVSVKLKGFDIQLHIKTN